MRLRQCIYCGRSFKPNPRVKIQKYCGDKACRRARRSCWQRDKMTRDPDYKDNQHRCQKQWQVAHPGYYKDYRAMHPEYVVRNRLLQIGRDARRRKNGPDLLAKMDSLIVKIIPINTLGTDKQVLGCLQKRTR